VRVFVEQADHRPWEQLHVEAHRAVQAGACAARALPVALSMKESTPTASCTGPTMMGAPSGPSGPLASASDLSA
jgi:hypothetical protein